MSRPSPDELAQIIGLSSDGQAAKPLSQEADEQAYHLIQSSGLFFGSFLERKSFCEELLAKYLPSLVRSFTADSPFNTSSLTALFKLAAHSFTASFARFIRMFPDEACAAYLVLFDVVGRESSSIYEILETSPTGGIRRGFIRLNPRGSLHRYAFSPPDEPAGSNSSSHRSFGARPPPCRCESDPRIGPHLERFGIRGPQVGNRAVLQGTDIPLNKDDIPCIIWRDCELRFAFRAKGGRPQIDCVKQKEGSEMMACSRCFSVRYCSKEHQRADWKHHKKF